MTERDSRVELAALTERVAAIQQQGEGRDRREAETLRGVRDDLRMMRSELGDQLGGVARQIGELMQNMALFRRDMDAMQIKHDSQDQRLARVESKISDLEIERERQRAALEATQRRQKTLAWIIGIALTIIGLILGNLDPIGRVLHALFP